MIEQIRANIVAVGKIEKHNLDVANTLVMQHLKGNLGVLGFTASCDNTSKLVYTSNITYKPDSREAPKITVYDYPVSFEDWRKAMEYRNVPSRFFKDDGPKLISDIEYKVSLEGWEKLDIKIAYMDDFINRLFFILKMGEGKIVPGRSLKLLYDNGNKLFMPYQFYFYLKKNRQSAGFAYTGKLSKE